MNSNARIDRIATLWNKDPEHFPEHVRRALSEPPSSRGDVLHSRHKKLPRTDGIFVDKVPLSAAEVDEYINSARFPHTKQKARVINFTRKLSLDDDDILDLIFMAILSLMLVASIAFVHEINVLLHISLALIAILGCRLALYASPTRAAEIKKNRAATQPTKRMKEIEDQSVDLSQLGSHIPAQAWNVYLYDRDYYGEFVSRCASALEVDAKYFSKTREAQRKVIDTLYEMSSLRQEETKRAIKASHEDIESIRAEAKNAQRRTEDQARQLENDIDRAQAEALTEMMLKPLEADLRAMKKVYNKESDA